MALFVYKDAHQVLVFLTVFEIISVLVLSLSTDK